MACSSYVHKRLARLTAQVWAPSSILHITALYRQRRTLQSTVTKLSYGPTGLVSTPTASRAVAPFAYEHTLTAHTLAPGRIACSRSVDTTEARVRQISRICMLYIIATITMVTACAIVAALSTVVVYGSSEALRDEGTSLALSTAPFFAILPPAILLLTVALQPSTISQPTRPPRPSLKPKTSSVLLAPLQIEVRVEKAVQVDSFEGT